MSAAPPPGAQTRIAARRTMDAGEPLFARVSSVTATARTARSSLTPNTAVSPPPPARSSVQIPSWARAVGSPASSSAVLEREPCVRPANEGRGSYRPTPFGGVWFAVEDGKLVIAGPDAWDGDWLPTPRTQRGRDHCISLASVTGDVIAITARRRGARIVYRIVDEWGTAFSVVRVTTDRPVYRLRRPVRITLTETNTSDHEVAAAIGCQILHS